MTHGGHEAHAEHTLTPSARFRFQFDEVLKDMLPIEPDILPEHQKNVERIKEWLKKDEIDNLILTTCELRRAWDGEGDSLGSRGVHGNRGEA